MVSACLEMNSAGEVAAHLLNPFLVLTGTTGPGQGNRPTCDTLYRDWPTRQGNTATVAFQPSHWFDTAITLRWLRWLHEQFPANTRIGLVWDHAPAHDSVAVREFISDNSSWLVVALIPEGMTSILQVCDIAANASLKRFIRAWYAKWRGKELTKIRAAQPTAEKNYPENTARCIYQRCGGDFRRIQSRSAAQPWPLAGFHSARPEHL